MPKVAAVKAAVKALKAGGRFDRNAESQQNTVALLWHGKRRGKTEVPVLPPEAKW